MDPGACLDALKKGEDISQPSPSTVQDQTHAIEAANTDMKELHPSTLAPDHGCDNDDEGNASVWPSTPDPNKECDVFPQYITSPPTFFRIFPKAVSVSDSQLNDHPSSPNIEGLGTPKDGVFDPFAPGPDMFLLAPHSKKYAQESRDNVVRHLTFDSSVCFVENARCVPLTGTQTAVSEEENLFQTVYGTLLEAIISMQTRGIPSTKYHSQISVIEGFETPNSATSPSGVAKTCPQAPVKPSRKFRRIQKGLCRKLEF